MFSRQFFLVVWLILCLLCCVSSWRRRRRRRAPPPPSVDCKVSSWSAWKTCSEHCKIGTQKRTRRIVTHPAYGGLSCPTKYEDSQQCGAVNGGCDHHCSSADGSCSCKPGYKLGADKKSCVDINECSDGSAQCINSKCVNTEASYQCVCLPGYSSSNSRRCDPKSCGLLTAPQCPSSAYQDVFGTTCRPANIECPGGREYLKSCTLSCPVHYKLAVISQPQNGQQFAQNFGTVDFAMPNENTVCTVDTNSGNVYWDWDPVTNPYYCRRINDPPLNITISNNIINEKQNIFTVVGKLSATDPQNDRLTYTIWNAEGNHYFLVQGNTLLVKARIVWNPDLARNNIYSVVMNVSDNGSPSMYSQNTLSVTVLNVNDPPYKLELSNDQVSENVAINFTVGNLTAEDDDVRPKRTSNFSWELVDSDNGFFSLRGNKVIVAKSLDHESTSVHGIQVRCTDYGFPRKSSQVSDMFISVLDMNDSPKYINLTNHRVPENSPKDYVVGEIIAIDDDNDTLSFDLSGTDKDILGTFVLKGITTCRIRLESGKSLQTCSVTLVVNASLDYEQKKEYVIWVGVTDPGGVTRKRFRIEVENVNEKSTDIKISNNKVPENSPGGYVIGEFLVEDPDNKNALKQTHTCSLVNSLRGDEDAFLIFRQNQRNFLHVKARGRTLDFESKRLYNITVSCKDISLGISKSLLVEITDVNEAPISLILSNTSVQESTSNESFISMLSAEDPEGTNQTFTYTVRDSSSSFRISGVNQNQLVHIGVINFELTPSIPVRLRVTDNGGLFFEKVFTITVKDVNDPPSDIRLHPNAILHENSGVNVFISSVEIIDEDWDSRAYCKLLDSDNNRVQFVSGNVLVGTVQTDYESLDSSKSLQIHMSCEDQHGANVTRWITLPVGDINEPPTDIILRKLEIRENLNDTLVGILEISDPDVGQRHKCSIINNGTKFYIDNTVNPPVLRTAYPLDFETSREEYVDIKCDDIVLDHKQPQFTTEKLFKIFVIDVNEVPEIICDNPFFVSPSFSRGSALGKIQNYDPDNEKYHRLRKLNPNGPFEMRKQLLNYSFENENYTWPFDITLNGIIYLEKPLAAEEYNGSIIFGVRVEDDGVVWERKNGEYQIKKVGRKFAIRNCTILISSNETENDIHLSSNTILENATVGTIIGKLSRSPSLEEHHPIKYHILKDEDVGQPFEIDEDILKLKLGNTLDYEKLSADKTLAVAISSVPLNSPVFSKLFLIKILDANEAPTDICLTSPRSLGNCSLVGHIFIEDRDYPDMQCQNMKTIDLNNKITEKLSEYTCHFGKGEDTLNNEVSVDNHFSIHESPPNLYVNKTIFARGNLSYEVPIECRNNHYPLHVLSKTLNVDIKVPDDATCRHDELCAPCPQPIFCLSHVKAVERCVGENYRINSTVELPDSVFKKPGFILKFENYIQALIVGGNSQTLSELVQEFNDENDASRKRRDAPPYSDVYVEQLLYSPKGTSTNVVFAVAERPGYKLIPASEVCDLLKETEVQCLSEDSNASAGKGGDEDDESGFPLWIIYIIVAVLVIAFIVMLVVWRRRKNQKNDNSAVVHFARDGDVATVDSMYETPVDERNHNTLSHSGTSDPVLIEKRQDIKVFHNPAYQSKGSVSKSEGDDEETKKRTFNHYETTDPPPLYETIDEDLYEKVREETVKEAEPAKKTTRKKSRSNPVYDIDEDDDSLNPVVNLSVRGPSRKANDDVFPPVDEETDSDDSLSAKILSTFQPDPKHKATYENVGTVNPLATHTLGDDKTDESTEPVVHINELYSIPAIEGVPPSEDVTGQSSC